MLQKFIVRALLLASTLAFAACDGRAPSSARQGTPIADAPSSSQSEGGSGGGAARASCADHYVAGRSPEILNPKLAKSTKELCFKGFSVMHSGITRTPLWSAERLDAQDVEASQQIKRDAKFYAEPRLQPDQRATLSDYRRSGCDRGHMTPSDDMPDLDSQRDTFSLANMVPQNHENNTRQWVAIEKAARAMTKREGELYIVTGPAYLGSNLQKIGNVLVPTHLYKLVYSPRQKAGAAWFIENQADAKANVIPIPELERIVGINLLPALSDAEKERMLRLPEISYKQGRARRGPTICTAEE